MTARARARAIVINLSMYYYFHIIVIDNVKIYKLLVYIILVTEVSINILVTCGLSKVNNITCYG